MLQGSTAPSFGREFVSEPYQLVDISAVLRHCRLTICEALVTGGASAALAALAASSVRLCRLVDNGSLLGSAAYETLRDVAGNLRLAAHCGEEAVAIAIGLGADLYDRLHGEAA